MKLISLEFQAFGSYKDRAKIDFTDLNRTFLITGSTGAGKSTIFDALTYAFYGEASSADGKGESDMRCRSADRMVPTEVKVVFEKDGRQYTIIRRPSQKLFSYSGEGSQRKNKELREKIGTGDKSVRLIHPDGVIDKDANKSIKDLIKLDKKQWRQVVMLAQGEFKTLLSADPKTRNLILQSIFGTESYKELNNRLKKELDDLTKSSSDIVARFETKLEAVGHEEDSPSGMILSEMRLNGSAAVNYNGTFSCIEGIIGEDRTALDMTVKNIGMLNEEKDSTLKILKDAETCLELYKGLDEKNNVREELLKDDDRIKELEHECERTDTALKNVRPIVQSLSETKTRFEKSIETIEDTKKKIADLEASKSKADKELIKATKADEKEQELRDSAALISGYLPKYEQLTALSKEIEYLIISIKTNGENKVRLECRSSELVKKRDELVKFLEDHRNNVVSTATIENDLKLIEERLGRIERLKTDGLRYVGRLDLLKTLKETYERSESSMNEKEEQKNQAFELYERNKKWLLAADLEEGMECPVCGSKHHPHKAERTDSKMDYDLFRKIERSWKTSVDKATDDKRKFDKFNNELNITKAGLEQTIDNLCIDVILDEGFEDRLSAVSSAELSNRDRMKQQLNDIISLEKKIVEKTKELQEVAKDIEENSHYIECTNGELIKFETELRNKTELDASIKTELRYGSEKEARSEMGRLTKEADTLRKAVRDAEDRCKAIGSEVDRINGALTSEESSLTALKESLLKTEGELERALSENGFTDIANYENYVSMERGLASKKKEVDNYHDTLTKIEERITQFIEQIGERERPENIDTLKAAYNETSLRYDSELEKKSKIDGRIHNNEDILTDLREQSSVYADIIKKKTMVERLHKLTNGEVSGATKVKFEDYILETYFALVLEEASMHFNKMIGRYAFQLHDKTASSDRAYEIDVYDAEEAGCRDVKTLSGGESFLASLSLALGLSDVIQKKAGGRTVEALFIDEGFGTLGKELAATTVRILNEVSNGQRPIGVITHIDELIPLVGTRIDVSYTKKEGSKLEVVFE